MRREGGEERGEREKGGEEGYTVPEQQRVFSPRWGKRNKGRAREGVKRKRGEGGSSPVTNLQKELTAFP